MSDSIDQDALAIRDHEDNLRAFSGELLRLLNDGNGAGQRVRSIHVELVYEDSEVYSHGVYTPGDIVTLLGALSLSADNLRYDINKKLNDMAREAGLEWPPDRKFLELGYRFGSGVKAAIDAQRDETESSRRAS